MKRLYFLLLITAFALVGCTKESNIPDHTLKVDKLILLDGYKGTIQDVFVSGSKTRLYVNGYPKSHMITLDENDSIIDDFEIDMSLSAMFLDNGNWVLYTDNYLEVFDTSNTSIASHILSTHTVYDNDVAKTPSGFAVYQRSMDGNFGEIEFLIGHYTNDGDSIGSKSFEYPHAKMATFIDLVANDYGLLILGTYGHSGIEHGYKMLFLDNASDTVWSRKIEGPSPAHYLSSIAKSEGFHMAYFTQYGSDWKIITLDAAGQTSASRSFTSNLGQEVNFFKYQSEYVGLFSNSGPPATLQLFDVNGNPKKQLSSNLQLTTAVSFFDTPTHFVIGGARYTMFDTPAFVRLKK
jgi:hypothetical protein